MTRLIQPRYEYTLVNPCGAPFSQPSMTKAAIPINVPSFRETRGPPESPEHTDSPVAPLYAQRIDLIWLGIDNARRHVFDCNVFKRAKCSCGETPALLYTAPWPTANTSTLSGESHVVGKRMG